MGSKNTDGLIDVVILSGLQVAQGGVIRSSFPHFIPTVTLRKIRPSESDPVSMVAYQEF